MNKLGYYVFIAIHYAILTFWVLCINFEYIITSLLNPIFSYLFQEVGSIIGKVSFCVAVCPVGVYWCVTV